MAKQKLTEIESIVDSDGVVHQQRRNLTVAWEQEPPYVKMYLDTVLYMKDLPKGHNSILLSLLKHMSYADSNEPQIIYVNSSMKKRIAQTLDVSVSRINNVISDLTAGEIFHRVDRGMYRVNPNLFGKGDWQDIAELRLHITFNADGKTVMGEVEKKSRHQQLRLVK